MTNEQDRTRYYIYYALVCVLALFFAWHVVIAYDTMTITDSTSIPIISAIIIGFQRVESTPFDLYITKSFLFGMGYMILLLAIAGIALFSVKRKTRFGEEQGSAEYEKKNKIKKLAETVNPDNNMIMTKDVAVSMDTRLTLLNNNIIVIGGSGSGKTRNVAKPNVLQANCSMVITDPKGELLRSTGRVLEDEGFIIRVFNLIEKEYSCCYNPFYYIHKESDVFKLINQLIKNTNPPNNNSSADPFWEKSETALLEAIFFYLWLESPKEEQNFKSVMQLIGIADASEDDETRESRLDVMFRQLADEKGEDYIPVKQYNIYRKASGKTAKSILISVGVRLSVFNLKDIENLTITDTLHLDEVGDRKTVVYIVIPDSDPSFNFLVSMLYSQLFDELYFQADFGELQWKNDRILYRSPESLIDKRNKLKERFIDYKKTVGELRKKELYDEIELMLKQTENEFGLGYPKLTGKITKKMITTHMDNMDSCLFRIRNRTATLSKYCKDLNDIHKSLKTLKEKNGITHYLYSTNKTKNMTPYQKKEIDMLLNLYRLEMRLNKEFGLTIPSEYENTFIFFKRVVGSDTRLKNIKELKRRANTLLFEMKNSEVYYGTKLSFDDKRTKLNLLSDEIRKKEEEIKQTSQRQVNVRNRLKKEIEKIKEQIRNIELIAEYEFGIKNLMDRQKNGGRLPVHVRCILDEFANIAPIPDFSKLVATMRSREISVTIILQVLSQIKEMFKDNWETITGNCDHFLFLGGQEQSTLEMVSKKMGKETIDKRSQGHSKGRQGSSSENWDTLGRELMMDFEVGQLDKDECILFIRGMKPIRSLKYPIKEHKRYKLMGETDNPNDPRLYDFYSKFNTVNTAKGIDQSRIMMDGEYKKILNKRIKGYADSLDISQTFESLSVEKTLLLTRTNLESNYDKQYEKDKAQMKRDVFKRQALVEVQKYLNNCKFDVDFVQENVDAFRAEVAKENIGSVKNALPSVQNEADAYSIKDMETQMSPYQEQRETAQLILNESFNEMEDDNMDGVSQISSMVNNQSDDTDDLPASIDEMLAFLHSMVENDGTTDNDTLPQSEVDEDISVLNAKDVDDEDDESELYEDDFEATYNDYENE